ncbi:WecB/TagA/CpsF family glycosyltransferase [Pseudomonas silesiensis]|uniref:WecB/TagA/CpsF family glycosyltransferase n=1 Tax=Pseudomonas silesiensis TaxID=1853130 RepID=UPI0030CAA101
MTVKNQRYFNGVQIDDMPLESLVQEIQSGALPPFSFIVTPNIDHFYRLDVHKNAEFISAYKNATFRVCDSRIAQKLSILEQKTIKNVVPGSDLTKTLLASNWARRNRILLVGATPEEAQKIKEKYNLANFQHYSPPMGFIKNENEILKCIELIKKTNANITFLAVGSPQQEILADRVNKSATEDTNNGSVMLCIGASFDFLSGKIIRAPIFIQKMHMEWLFRALSDPKRLIPRYWKNFTWILRYVFKRALSNTNNY